MCKGPCSDSEFVCCTGKRAKKLAAGQFNESMARTNLGWLVAQDSSLAANGPRYSLYYHLSIIWSHQSGLGLGTSPCCNHKLICNPVHIKDKTQDTK